MMAFIDVYNASIDTTFQGRCWASALKIAAAIIRGDTLTTDVSSGSQSLNTESCLNFALKLVRRQTTLNKEQIATMILANTTIAAEPTGASKPEGHNDADIEWQTKEDWLSFVNIG